MVFGLFILKKLASDGGTLSRCLSIMLPLYLVLILFATLGLRAEGEQASINLRIFQAYRGLANQISYHWRTYRWSYNEEQFRIISTGICNILLNVALFVPIGYLLPTKLPQKLNRSWKVLLFGFGLSLLIETAQLMTHRGYFDLDDLFHNTLGTMIGYGLYKIFLSREPKSQND